MFCAFEDVAQSQAMQQEWTAKQQQKERHAKKATEYQTHSGPKAQRSFQLHVCHNIYVCSLCKQQQQGSILKTRHKEKRKAHTAAFHSSCHNKQCNSCNQVMRSSAGTVIVTATPVRLSTATLPLLLLLPPAPALPLEPSCARIRLG
jgi:hypothetical protein